MKTPIAYLPFCVALACVGFVSGIVRADLTNGLVAHYSFDGNANDLSGNGNNATVYGAQLTEDRFGIADHAYLFDGLNDTIEAPHSASLDITGPITVSCWVKAQDTYWRSGLVIKAPDRDPSVGYHLRTVDDKAHMGLYYTINSHTHGGLGAASNTLVTDDQWRLVTGTYDGSSIRMYVDGQLETTVPYSIGYESNTAALQIGHLYYPYNDAHGGRNDVSLNGAIDDVRIYDRALSGEEVRQLMAPVPPQNVYLAWGQDLPVLIERKKMPFKNEYTYPVNEGSMAAATVAETFKTAVEDRVEAMFSDSGVTNIQFVDSPDDATVVYFTEEPTGPWSLLGKAYSGLDRFNRDLDGAVAVFVQNDEEMDAETATHEIGHTLGLRHINPGTAEDPTNQSVMDYDTVSGDRGQFINGVFEITEPPNDPNGGTGRFHNPVYHLKRYVDGIGHNELVAGGTDPGSWDTGLWEKIKTKLGFGGADRILYDVVVLVGNEHHRAETLAVFDEITLSELAQLEFMLDSGASLQLYAASAEGSGWDTALATGDPYEEDATLVAPVDGTISGFLQEYSSTEPNGYVTVAAVEVTGEVVPEPATMALLALGGLAVLRRRRKQ